MEKTSKKLNRILLLVGLVVLIAAFGLIMASCSREEAQSGPQEPQLYWNVEGADYRSGKFTRMAGEEGYVYMIFARDGEQVRLPVKDITLANKIDMLKCMGLVLDANGLVVDAVHVEDFTGGYLVKEYVVTSVDGYKITTNSSGLLDGHEVVFEITEDTPVWNIGGTGITVGIPWTVGEDDLITVIKNEDGSIKCVYTEAYTPPQDIYWNVNRMYDSSSKMSTRMSEPTGGYLVTLACNGEVKDYKVKESKVVQQLDAMAAKCFGLEFDEEGTIIGVIHAGSAAGGGSVASWYHCVGLDGMNASFKRVANGSNMGATYEGVLSKYCQVYDVSGTADYVGEPTELRVGDQVHCLLDNRGRVCVVFVVSRKVESEIYWNVERKYDSTAKKTTRSPAADGWYYITVAVRGKQITVKTQDWNIANSIDGRAAQCFGLKLDENNVIEKFYTPDSVTSGTFASWYDVTAIEGKTLTLEKAGTGDVKVGTLAADCEIYDVSSTATVVGQVTEVKVGDRVHTLKNMNGEICVCYVVTRFVDWPVYYNLDRKWSSTTNSTTRTPDADGYYVFRMAVDGQEVTLKTTSKNVANAIDKEVAKCLTLSVDQNGIIYKAMHAKNTTVAKGAASSSYTTVTELSKNGFTTYKSDNGKYTKETYAWNAKVYNVSTNFIDHQGEETELQVGDFVHCLTNRRGEVTFVYVMTRYMDLDVYYNLDRMWSDTTGASTRTPDADGVYSIQMAYGGEEVTVKTTDPEVVYNIDKEVAKCVGIKFDENGMATYATHAKNTDYCRGGIGMSYATVTAVEGDQVTVLKDGKSTTFTISENCEMFVTTNIEDLTRGQYTTVRVGDFVHCLKEQSGKTNYMAIMSRVKQLPVADHTCQHVTDNVTWYEWDGTEFPIAGHYVLTEDLDLTERISISAGTEVTLCLNGHTVTNTDRFFSVYGTLNICDHKDAGGAYSGKLSTSFGGSVYGGIAYMYNNSSNSTINIYGGILEHTGQVSNGGLFYVGNKTGSGYQAQLNIYDGTLTGGSATGTGGGIFISNGCEVNMYGGKLTGCTSKDNGGGLSVDNGTFNMTGGVIESCTAKEGGNVRVGSKGTANISKDAVVQNGSATNGGNFTVIGKLNITDGATVTGGKITGQGTAISAFANAASAHAIVTVKNVTLDGSVRADTGKGPVEVIVQDATVTGQIKVGVENCTLTVGGKVDLNEVRLLDGKVIAIHEDGLDDASSIKVTMDNVDLAFATITDPNDEKCFTPANPAIYKVVNDNGDLYLESTVKPHIHCVCGTNTSVGNHTTCATTQEWLAWTDDSSLPAEGTIVLMNDVDLGSSTFTLAAGRTLSICLNGHTIRSDIRVLSIRGTLNITDCSGTGSVIGNEGGTQANGGVFYVYNNATFNLYGGTLTAPKKVTGEGGVGCVAGGTNGVMNMYGGTIENGQATKNGGNIIIWDGANLNIYGGTIQNGTSTGGGNIGTTKGTLTISGGKLIGGTSTGYGGNVRVGQQATLKVTGGEILGGAAKSGGSTIYGNRSGTAYADIQLLGGKITAGTLTGSSNAAQNCVLNFGSVTVGGDVQIENIYVGGYKLIESTEKALTAKASIGVSNASAVTFMENVSTDLGCFTSKATGLSVVYDEAAQTLKLA